MRYALLWLVLLGMFTSLSFAADKRIGRREPVEDPDRQPDPDQQEADAKRDEARTEEERRARERQQKQEDDKRRAEQEDDKRELDKARDRLRSAEHRASRARDDRANAIRDRERYGQELSQTGQDEGELTRLLAAAQTDARAAKASYDAAKREADQRAARVEQVKRSLAEVDQNLEEAKKQAQIEFMKTEESKARSRAIADAHATLADEQKRVLDALAVQPSYKSLKSTAGATEAAVEAARKASPIHLEVLSRASQEWIDAKSKLQAVERAACENDPAYMQAVAKVGAAENAQATALAAFRASVEQLPRIASHVARRLAVVAEHEGARRDLESVANALRATETDLRDRVGRYDQASIRLQSARSARDRLVTQVTSAEQRVRSAEADIVDADNDIARARRLLKEAERQARH